MAINKVFLFAIIVFFGCVSEKNEETPEIRVYEVNAFVSDSVRYDTLVMDPTQMEGLTKMVYEIDSVLSINDGQKVSMLGYSISISGYDMWSEVRLTKYIVEIPVEYGKITLFGIFAQDIGSAYLRWLDGSKSLVLKEKLILEQTYHYDGLMHHLHQTILAVPPIPDDKIQGNGEIEGGIEIDTLAIKEQIPVSGQRVYR